MQGKGFIFSYVDKELSWNNSYSQYFPPLICGVSAALKELGVSF